MRGKDGVLEVADQLLGITPACAGKSAKPLAMLALMPGSPPRMRGKVVQADPAARSLGITPAYAGKRPTVGGFIIS